MPQHSTAHDTFVIERTYNVPPKKVFAAFSSAEAKSRWFGAEEDGTPSKLKVDFRVGGLETFAGGPPGEDVHKYESTFADIVPDERIVSTYKMWKSDDLMSVSIATTELKDSGSGTKLTYTEQGVFLDGIDEPSIRKHGVLELFKALDSYLEKTAGAPV